MATVPEPQRIELHNVELSLDLPDNFDSVKLYTKGVVHTCPKGQTTVVTGGKVKYVELFSGVMCAISDVTAAPKNGQWVYDGVKAKATYIVETETLEFERVEEPVD